MMTQPGCDGSIVYFVAEVGARGLVKIGTTADFNTRLSALKSSSPVDLRVLRTIPGGRWEERWYHQRYASHRQKGEWFAFNPVMLRDVPPPPPPTAEAKPLTLAEDVLLVMETIVRLMVREHRGKGGSTAGAFAAIAAALGVSERRARAFHHGEVSPADVLATELIAARSWLVAADPNSPQASRCPAMGWAAANGAWAPCSQPPRDSGLSTAARAGRARSFSGDA